MVEEIINEKPIKEKYYFFGNELVQTDPSYFIAIKSMNTLKTIQKLAFNVSASSHVEFRIYEESEIVGGNIKEIFNFDRTAENNSVIEVLTNPGIINTGNNILFLSKGKEGYEQPIEFSNDWNKFTLKKDIWYIIEIASKIKNNKVNYWFNWEEIQ
jgi:hypothetical protein